MSSIPDPRVARFADKLDAIIEDEQSLPADDRCNYAELVGVLEFKKFVLMKEAQEASDE